MLYYDRIDVSERIDVNKTRASKSALIATCKVREQDEMNCEANRDDKRLIQTNKFLSIKHVLTVTRIN